MMQPKVSVIMPSKNVEKYIGMCLDSVQQQTLEDIEIICVDAMSTDGTREIIRGRQEKDNRIRLLDDDKGSSGYADNLGFKSASGKYVSIVETDDYIRPEMLKNLYERAESEQLDYIKADFSMFVEMNGHKLTVNKVQPLDKLNIYNRVIDTRDCPILLEKDGYLWRGIYRRDFIVNDNLWLNETKGAAYQDNGFLHRTITHGRRVMYVPESYYQYRRDNDNSSDYNPRGLEMMAEEYKFIESDKKRKPKLFEPFLPVYYLKLFHQFTGQASKVGTGYESIRREVASFRKWLMEGRESGNLRIEIFEDEYSKVEDFLDEPEAFLNNFWKKTSDNIKAWEIFIDDLMRRGREFVVVSAGDRGKGMYMLLVRNLPRSKVWICDNAASKHGKKIGYSTVMPVELTVQEHPAAVYVVANEKYGYELREQLQSLGIDNKNIIVSEMPVGPHFGTSWTR